MSSYRLGFYTGKVYKDDEINHMVECGQVINEEIANNKDLLEKLQLKNFTNCSRCIGMYMKCPNIQNELYCKEMKKDMNICKELIYDRK